MADTTLDHAAGDVDDHGHDAHDHAHDAHGHPSEKQYWIIFAFLGVLTALEVAWSYMGLSGPALVVPLIIMMVIKFLVVAGVFMHLYFDLQIINGRLFTWAFAAAIALAILVYFVMFASFDQVF